MTAQPDPSGAQPVLMHGRAGAHNDPSSDRRVSAASDGAAHSVITQPRPTLGPSTPPGATTDATLIVTLRFFARARQIAGTDRAHCIVPIGASIAAVRQQLARAWPDFQPLLPHLLVACDAEYATDDRILTRDCELAWFPPVSGG